jgi:hypothetical protein
MVEVSLFPFKPKEKKDLRPLWNWPESNYPPN